MVSISFLLACTDDITDDNEVIAEKRKIPTERSSFLPYIVNPKYANKDVAAAYGFVDSANPNEQPWELRQGSTGAKLMQPRFYTGNLVVDPITQTPSITHYHMDSFLYEVDGKIYKTDISDVFIPERLQVSSESQSELICHQWDQWADDFINIENSVYIYYRAISKDQCFSFDGQWRMIQLGMSENDAPIVLPGNIDYFVSQLHNHNTGGLAGWLLVETQNGVSSLVRYDTTFQNRIVLENNLNSNVTRVANTKSGNVIYLSGASLKEYSDHSGNQIISQLEIMDSALSANSYLGWVKPIGDDLFFTLNHFDGESTLLSSSLKRVSSTSLSNSLIDIKEQISPIQRMESSNTILAFVSNEQIKTVDPKTFAVSVMQMPTGKLLAEENKNKIFYALGDFLFVEISDFNNANQRQVWVVNSTLGLDDVLQDHYIVGAIYSNEVSFYRGAPVTHLLVETGGVQSGQRTVHVLDSQQYPNMKVLGSLANNTDQQFLKRYYATGHKKGLLEGTINGNQEIYFFDADRENSLVRVTNNDSQERVINH